MATYDDWVANDCGMMRWLLNNKHEKVSPNVMSLKTAKEICDALKEMYSNEHNISRVVDLYEKSFSLRQDGYSLSDYYSELKGTLDELDFYQPHVLDLKVLHQYRDELVVANFISGLDTSLMM